MSKRHSIAEIRRWLALRVAEGLSIKQLTQRSGIPAHVFIYRAACDKRSREAPANPTSGFVEVVAAEPASPAPRAFKSSGIELVFSSGLRATLAADFDCAAFGRLLAQLRC